MKTLINDGIAFVCNSDQELWRARTLLTKEPGTIAWLNEQLHDSDVFFDIGANVGCYSLYAARLVGEQGRVYAFEPHPANVSALLKNIAANPSLTGRIRVITTPVGNVNGWQQFTMGSGEAGTSGSTLSESGQFTLLACSIDKLIADGAAVSPDVIKIDVDGNEPEIVAGMQRTLKGSVYPRSVQVESEPTRRVMLRSCMEANGYQLTGTHYTKLCQESIDRGVPPSIVIENAIFERAA